MSEEMGIRASGRVLEKSHVSIMGAKIVRAFTAIESIRADKNCMRKIPKDYNEQSLCND